MDSTDSLETGLLLSSNGYSETCQVTFNTLGTQTLSALDTSATNPLSGGLPVNAQMQVLTFSITDGQIGSTNNGLPQGCVGDPLVVTCSGLLPTTYYGVNFDGTWGLIQTDSSGNFAGPLYSNTLTLVTVPETAGGLDTVLLIAGNSGSYVTVGTAAFTVLPTFSVTDAQTGLNNGLSQGCVNDQLVFSCTGAFSQHLLLHWLRNRSRSILHRLHTN